MYKYCIDEIILTVTEFEARWKIHDFEISPDLPLHPPPCVAFHTMPTTRISTATA